MARHTFVVAIVGVAVSGLRLERCARSSARFVVVLSVLAGCMTVSSASAQPAPNTVVLQPAPDIAGVIKGGTLPKSSSRPASSRRSHLASGHRAGLLCVS